ncbi:MAG: hypothetical protein FD127_3311, partial [Acidimicrobiaceae bacterium]
MNDHDIERALDRDVSLMRPEFRNELASLLDAARPAPVLLDDGDSGTRRQARRWLLPTVAVALVAAIVGLGVIVTRNDPTSSTETPTLSATDALATASQPATTGDGTVPPTSTELEAGKIELRGDGLGVVSFGDEQADVLATLGALLGPARSDSQPSTELLTPSLRGCANHSMTFAVFPELVVGFTDNGSGPILDAWAARGDYTTPEGLSAGAGLATLFATYGTRAVRAEPVTGWEWLNFGVAPTTIISAVHGELILLTSDLPTGPPLLTAGAHCLADAPATANTQPPPSGDYIPLDMSAPDSARTI